MKKLLLLNAAVFLLLFLPATLTFAQVQTFYVYPSQTDPGYSTMEDSMAISINTSTQQNKLFLFIGGTNSSSSSNYTALRLRAANLGFDFVNLNYPDSVAAASLKNDTDSLAFDKFRQEICYGTPLSNVIEVDTFHAIATRTVKLLQYLTSTFPTHNWGQYLATANTVDWSKIIIGGHSQGSGHAAYIAKQVLVDRVLMFSGPNDHSEHFSNSAPWLSEPGTTPTNRHFAYLSLNDEIVAFFKQYTNLTGLGMLANDDSTYVDNATPPYGGSHILYTTQSPGIVILNHNVPVKLSSINTDVWTYMLTSTVPTSLHLPTSPRYTIFPNPATTSVRITSPQAWSNENYTLRNIMGQIVATGRISTASKFTIDVSELMHGVYFLTVGNETKRVVKR